MRRPPTSALVLLLLILGIVSACSDDSAEGPATTSTTLPVLDELALSAGDLPDGFTASSEVDDTITAFCVNEDAAAGLRASAREVRGFTRTPAGASVIQLVFRFDEGAPAFVTQAEEILDRCSGVPDVTGLAFEYEALTDGVDDAIAEASETHVSRFGASVGSGNLTLDVAVFQRDGVGQLVAVLGLDLPRADLDALAAAVFEAVAAKVEPTAGSG
jgi:hypothetical protein